MNVYVVRDSAGNIRGVTSTEPSIPSSNYYEVFTLDTCLDCGAEVVTDCVCDDDEDSQ